MEFNGQLKGLPKIVVDKMLYYQVQQGNKRDIKVFEENKYAGAKAGGFDWGQTPETYVWIKILLNDEYNIDNINELCKEFCYPDFGKIIYFIKGINSKNSEKVIDKLIEMGGVNSKLFSGDNETRLYYIEDDGTIESLPIKSTVGNLIMKNGTELFI